MKFLLVTLLLVGLFSCQIDLMDNPESGRTIVPDTEAKIARKLYVDSQDERTVRSEERYFYTPTRQLDRIDRLSYNNAGIARRYSYDQYSYNSAGQLIRVTVFVQNSSIGTDTFQPSQYRNYEYPAPDRTLERSFYLNMSVNGKGETYEMSRVNLSFENGKLRQIGRYGVNNQQPVFQSYETYQYDLSGRLITLDYRDPMGKLINTTRYTYKGRTALVERVMLASETTRPYQSMLYDSRGRLVRQLNLGYYYGSGYSSFYSADDMRLSSFYVPTTVKFEYLD